MQVVGIRCAVLERVTDRSVVMLAAFTCVLLEYTSTTSENSVKCVPCGSRTYIGTQFISIPSRTSVTRPHYFFVNRH